MTELLPLFLNLTERPVLLVGGGRVAAAKLRQLLAAGARVRVVSPVVQPSIAASDDPRIDIVQRGFVASDLDDVWLVVAAATPAVNRAVAEAAEVRRVFVNAVDDPANASAFLSGVIRRDGVTVAISTSGDAPALTALVRESLDALLPRDLADWMQTARDARVEWRRLEVPIEQRKPQLLSALNDLYDEASPKPCVAGQRGPVEREASAERSTVQRIPWLTAPEDSWL